MDNEKQDEKMMRPAEYNVHDSGLPAKNPGAFSAAASVSLPPSQNLKTQGFRGWLDYRLWLAVTFHIAACIVFYQSPFYSTSEFHLFKLFWDLIFALLVMSTLCWEWRLFGPINAPNTLSHISFLFSLTFLFDRFFTRPVDILPTTYAGILGSIIGKAASVIIESLVDFVNNILHLPIWLQEIFRSPLLMILFIALCLILNLPRRKGVPALGILMILYTIATIANPRSSVDVWFFGGIILIAAALYLQYHDSLSYDFWKVIRSKLGGRDHYKNVAAKGSIVKSAFEDKSITDIRVRAIVAQYFALDENSPACYQESARVLRELVIRDAVLASELTERGFIFFINPTLLETNDYLSRFPQYFRGIVIGVVALLWLLMPLDMLPDSIPIVGIIDDLIICASGGKILLDAFDLKKNAEHLPAPRRK